MRTADSHQIKWLTFAVEWSHHLPILLVTPEAKEAAAHLDTPGRAQEVEAWDH